MLAASNLATSFASAILAKDTASEGGMLIDKETREAVATSQALKMYSIGAGGSENERRLRELQASGAAAPGTFFTTVPVADALAMLLDCYEGMEIVQVKYEESPGQVATKVICNPGSCAITRTSTFTMERDGESCTKSSEEDSTCVPVAGELCTETDAKLTFLHHHAPARACRPRCRRCLQWRLCRQRIICASSSSLHGIRSFRAHRNYLVE